MLFSYRMFRTSPRLYMAIVTRAYAAQTRAVSAPWTPWNYYIRTGAK
jgi:hypothetical protein